MKVISYNIDFCQNTATTEMELLVEILYWFNQMLSYFNNNVNDHWNNCFKVTFPFLWIEA